MISLFTYLLNYIFLFNHSSFQIVLLFFNNIQVDTMTRRFLTVVFIITILICKTKFPIVPVIDIDSFTVETPKLKCESGCLLVDPGEIQKIHCFKTDDDNRSPQAKDETEVVFVADQSYYCKTNINLPDKVKFEIVKFECQFSDEKDLLMIDDSCVVSYMLVTKDTDARTEMEMGLSGCPFFNLVTIHTPNNEARFSH